MGVGMWDPGDDTKYSLHKPLAADDDTPKYSPDPKASAASERKFSHRLLERRFFGVAHGRGTHTRCR
jgi:hypothetical protein